MPVPFGLSIGDFITFIETTATIVNALKDSTGAAKEYQGVIRELDSLKLALVDVQNVETDDPALKAALGGVASNCQRTVQEFLDKIQKFGVSLRDSGNSRRRIKDGLRKIQWALYTKEDIRKFQMQLFSHTTSLNILVLRVRHMTATAAQKDQQETLSGHTQALIRIESKIEQDQARAAAMRATLLAALMRC